MASTARAGSAALEALLASLEPPERMLAFYEERLGGLRDYDRVHRSHLVRTLDAYFASGGSLSTTARQLQTHRNTVLYRLRRVEELLHANLRDPQVALELQVALRIGAALSR